MRIYLDHAATSFPKAPGVTEAMHDFLDQHAGNPGRGGHRLTIAASRHVEGARCDIAEFLGGDPERTMLGPGATFWINTVIRGFLREGYWADLVIVDTEKSTEVTRERVISKCGWSPFEGQTFRSGITATLVNGQPAWHGGQIMENAAAARLKVRPQR